MPGLHYEEFSVGQAFDHEWTRTVTEMDNTLFSTLTLNVQPLHLDEHFSAGTEFGQRIVNSLFTLGLMIGMTVNDTTLRTTIANLGMTDVRRSEEHTSELQSLMRISYAGFSLKKKKTNT